MPEPAAVDSLDPFDDFTLVPVDKKPLLRDADQTITFDVVMDNLGDGRPYAFFNNITWVKPKVPTLYTVMSTGEAAANPLVYGEFSHSFVLDRHQVVEIVVNNLGKCNKQPSLHKKLKNFRFWKASIPSPRPQFPDDRSLRRRSGIFRCNKLQPDQLSCDPHAKRYCCSTS